MVAWAANSAGTVPVREFPCRYLRWRHPQPGFHSARLPTDVTVWVGGTGQGNPQERDSSQRGKLRGDAARESIVVQLAAAATPKPTPSSACKTRGDANWPAGGERRVTGCTYSDSSAAHVPSSVGIVPPSPVEPYRKLQRPPRKPRQPALPSLSSLVMRAWATHKDSMAIRRPISVGMPPVKAFPSSRLSNRPYTR